MLNKITFGRYYSNTSIIHSMDVLIKIVCSVLFMILSFLSYNYKLNIVIIFLLILLILLSKVPIKLYLKSIYNLKWFLISIFLLNILFNKNIYTATITVFRVVYVMLYAMIVLFTTKNSDLVDGLKEFFSPLKIIKIPINKMAFSIALALKFIPVLFEQANRITKAQLNKVNYKEVSMIKRISLLKSIVIPMFITSIKRSDRLADAMEVRSYDINKYYKRKIKFNYFDIFILVIHLVLLILIIKEEVFL